MVKLIVFDFDDTLFFTTSAHAKSYTRAIFEVLKVYVSEQLIEKEIKAGAVFPDFLTILPSELSNDLAMEIHRRKNEIYQETLIDIQVNESIANNLPDISSKCFTAIWSNSSRANIDLLLSKHNLSFFFHLIYSREDFRYRKPDTESYKALCAKFSVPVQESMLVDDSNVNLEAINRIGAIGVLPSNFNASSF